MRILNKMAIGAVVVAGLVVTLKSYANEPPAPGGGAGAGISRPSEDATKWGPKLTEDELSRIAKLSVPELAAMLRTGDTLHAYAALRALVNDGAWLENYELLLSIATEVRGDMIVESLARPVASSDPAEVKQFADTLLAFLEDQLRQENPKVSQMQAIRGIGKALQRGSDGNAMAKSPQAPADELVYGFARGQRNLIGHLSDSQPQVRREVIRWLAEVSAVDTDAASVAIAALDARLIRERALGQDPDVREEMEREIDKASTHLRTSLKQLRAKVDGTSVNSAPGKRVAANEEAGSE